MSLAVGEHRPQQHRDAAGCVGIFFQLFSKKKLFSSNKLLPPPAKKFAGDVGMPMAKLLLIAEENRGGFPRLESVPGSDLESRMQVPGIVARLMGLESMPVVDCEKPRKGLDSKLCGEGSFEHSRIDQGLCVDNVNNAKGELRLQKLQNTGGGRGGFLEWRSVEAFHKGLVYVSTKKQYKLETPVKSPRLPSRSSTSRLVQVANRILEPGLQSRGRAKCAITYEGSWRDEREGDGERQSDSVTGSCKSCGSSVGVKESLNADCGSGSSEVGVKESLNADCGSGSSDLSCGSEESKKMKNDSVTIQSKLKAEGMYMMKMPLVQVKQNNHRSLAHKSKLNVESRAHDLMERKTQLGSTGDQYRKSAKNYVESKSVIRVDNLRQSKSPVRERVVQTEKKLNELNRAKNFVAMNKNVKNYSRSRSPTKVSSSRRGELERDGWERNLARKRTPISRNAETFSTNLVKERSVRSNGMSRKGIAPVSNQSVNRSCIKSNLRKMDCDSITGSNNNDIVSFTFNSPMRRDSRFTTHEEMTRDRRCQGELKHDACHSKKLSDAKHGRLPSRKVMVLRGDELSNILGEKIRELSSFDRDELASGDELQGRSTVSILEELISTLTTVTPESRKDGDCCSDVTIQTEISVFHNQRNMDEEFQEKAQSAITATYLTGIIDQPSPVSILDASLSNDSCSLGSLNGSPGSIPELCVPEKDNNTQSSDMEADLLDSASSSNISYSVNQTMSTHDIGVSETELSTEFESISDAELLFENISFFRSDRTLDYSFDSFLLDTLESIIDIFCLNFKPAKEGNQLREFLFDCIMECLESKFSHFCRSGFRTWLKLPLILNRDQLMAGVHVEIRGWRELAGKTMDDLIEKDMAGSNMKWTGCETESFDTGVEIQSDILHGLIDEMVIDLR